MSAKQKIVNGHGPLNIILGIFACSFDGNHSPLLNMSSCSSSSGGGSSSSSSSSSSYSSSGSGCLVVVVRYSLHRAQIDDAGQ